MGSIVTIAGDFIPGSFSASMGQENHSVFPENFTWAPCSPASARFVTDSHIKEAPGKGQVAWLLEPPLLHYEDYLEIAQRFNEFDAVLMHSGLDTVPTAKFYPLGGSFISKKNHGVHHKNKLVSMIISSKNTMPGHKLRHEVAERYGNSIDIWQDFGNSKLPALAPYMFSIVIESQKTQFYFTEKIVDCLSVGTIPIYWGAEGIERFFDIEGIIPVNTIEDIGRALTMINTELFMDLLSSVNSNYTYSQLWACTEDNIYQMYPELFDFND